MKTVSTAGVEIPILGLGVFQMSPEDTERMVTQALEVGYRHIDTAAMYQNETEVGHGLRASSVDRDKVFLTTKVWREFIGAGDLQKSAEDSLKRLNQDYVDLLLIHWPNAAVPLEESIGALNDIKRRGLARAIGVANFPSAMFEKAVGLSEAPLATNQVEYHPSLSQRAVLEAVRRHNSTLTAYSPLARGGVAREPVLIEIGETHGMSPAQIALRWFPQQERVIAIPKTANPARLRENLEIFDFGLTDEEMVRISAIARPGARLVSPPFAPEWDAD